MKKIFAILLSMMLVLSMGAVALADTEGGEVSPNPPTITGSEAKTFTFSKTYKTTAGNDPANFPAETLSFTVTPSDGNPDNTAITIADSTVSGNPGNITVTVPSYDKVGKWNYTVKEVPGTTQGVTYSEVEFGVQVVVTYDENDNLVSETAFTTKGADDVKISGIVNNYDLGNLTIDKNVAGNLASKTQKFDIDVTFTSANPVMSTITGAATIAPADWTEADGKYTCTKTVSLADGDTVATFSNIPAGVTYTVAEQAKHAEADANGSDPSKGYTATYENEDGSITADSTAEAIVLNTKGTNVDTGVTTDSLPYVMLLGFVVLAGAALLMKRRMAHNN